MGQGRRGSCEVVSDVVAKICNEPKLLIFNIAANSSSQSNAVTLINSLDFVQNLCHRQPVCYWGSADQRFRNTFEEVVGRIE
jgi:hypothetical protein